MLFYKKNDSRSTTAEHEIDSIDDDLRERGVSIVKTTSEEMIEMYDIDQLPKIVFFESEIPTFWPDEKMLDSNETMLDWIKGIQVDDLYYIGEK